MCSKRCDFEHRARKLLEKIKIPNNASTTKTLKTLTTEKDEDAEILIIMEF
jgi:hypothetical protein